MTVTNTSTGGYACRQRAQACPIGSEIPSPAAQAPSETSICWVIRPR